MGCAMSTESLKEEGPIFGALKERGAVWNEQDAI
jgi:hypothetical protein